MKFFTQSKSDIQEYLNSYLQVKQKELSKQYAWAPDAIPRLKKFVLPGKMIRGGLVVLGAEPKSKTAHKDAVIVGAALELLHSGILIHDDIMDKDEFRRGHETIHTQYKQLARKHKLRDDYHYGESMAASIGIIAYSLAVDMIASISNKKAVPDLACLFGMEMAALGLAQMQDVDGGYHRKEFTPTDVKRLYEQKTGRYTFTLPLQAGMILSGKKSTKKATLNELGKTLGVVFQLQDDILSLTGDPKQTGKPLAADIRERKQTLLYIKLVEMVGPSEAKKVIAIFKGKSINNNDVKYVLQLIEKYKVIDWAKKIVSKQVDASRKLLKGSKMSPHTVEQLNTMLSFLISREK